MNAARRRSHRPGLATWLWMLVRRDIGRKLTAFAVALTLWYALANLITGERRITLDVRIVPSLMDADQQRNMAPAIYLVVPDDLIVRDTSPKEVRLDVKGNKDDVRDLDISAVIVLDESLLLDQDEAVVTQLLDRERFRARTRDPRLSEFKVRPATLDVTLARRGEAELLLGPENVVVVGRPKEGYTFEASKIRIVPNRVRIMGPRSAVENLVANPDQLKLAAIDVEGRILEVSQQVGIDLEKVDRSVSLRTVGGVVEVSVPVRAREISRELLSIPVRYENADELAVRRRRVISATKTLDLQLTGPRSVLEGLTAEQLAARLWLVFDWRAVSLDQAREKVAVYRIDLPDSVRITDPEGRPPEISYRLETVGTEGATGTSGDPPS